jgi:hypothetical protein
LTALPEAISHGWTSNQHWPSNFEAPGFCPGYYTQADQHSSVLHQALYSCLKQEDLMPLPLRDLLTHLQQQESDTGTSVPPIYIYISKGRNVRVNKRKTC